jgi:hypothetical protein
VFDAWMYVGIESLVGVMILLVGSGMLTQANVYTSSEVTCTRFILLLSMDTGSLLEGWIRLLGFGMLRLVNAKQHFKATPHLSVNSSFRQRCSLPEGQMGG